MVAHLLRCQCGHTMNDLGIHLLFYPCESECIVIHDTLQDTIATIALESGAHIQKEVFHLFLCYTWGQMDIVITRDGFQTLVDIVIANSTRTNLVQCASTTTHAIIIAAQNKT